MSESTPNYGTTYDGRIKTYPMIEMGHGLVSVAPSEIDGVKAVIFIKLPKFVPIGEEVPAPEGKTHFDPEDLAGAITFASVAGLDVLIEKLAIIRSDMVAAEEKGLE